MNSSLKMANSYKIINFFRNPKFTNGLYDHYSQAALLSQHAQHYSTTNQHHNTRPAQLTSCSSSITQHLLWQYECRIPAAANTCQLRYYSMPQRPTNTKTFFGKILQNVKEDTAQIKQVQESMEQFQKQIKEAGGSETARKAREKFQKIEEETSEGAEKTFKRIKKSVSETVEQAKKNEILQKASKMTEQVSRNISAKTEVLSKSQAYKTISVTAQAVKDEISSTALSGSSMAVYRPPTKLRMRKDWALENEQRIIEANTEATGMVMHKDSRFSQSWQKFKETNRYINRVMDWSNKLGQSDHFIVRAATAVKDGVTDTVVAMLAKTEMSEALTEICKIDPNFSKEMFLMEVEHDILPNVLEAMLRPDLPILKDWTYEAAYAVIAADVRMLQALGHKRICKAIEVSDVELVLAKMLEGSPIMGITFTAQVTDCVKNIMTGKIISGCEDTVMRRSYIWIICRDQEETEPRAAWKLMEYTHHAKEQFL